MPGGHSASAGDTAAMDDGRGRGGAVGGDGGGGGGGSPGDGGDDELLRPDGEFSFGRRAKDQEAASLVNHPGDVQSQEGGRRRDGDAEH